MKVLICGALTLVLVLGLALGAVVNDSPDVTVSPKPKDSPAVTESTKPKASPVVTESTKPKGSPAPIKSSSPASPAVKETVPEDCEPNICNTGKVTCPPVRPKCATGTMSRDFGTGFCGCCPACVQLKGKGERCLENDDYQEYTTEVEQVVHPGLCKSPLKCIKGKCT